MQRIPSVDPAQAQGKAAELLAAVKKRIGIVPNFFKTAAQSPAVLQGFLSQGEALSLGVLPAGLREQIALAVAGINGCDYCASAHTLMAKGAGVTEAEAKQNLRSTSGDAKTQAALQFVKKVTESHGRIDAADLQAVRGAGFDDAAIVEMIAHVSINIFTNYLNNVAETEIDFPHVDACGSCSKAA